MERKKTEAIDRMKQCFKQYGRDAYRNDPQFCTDSETLIEAIRGEQRQEPKIGDAPTEQRRYICERCGDSGLQPAGCWTGKAYDSIAGRCELCAEPPSNP
jgi:hypothetical protein